MKRWAWSHWESQDTDFNFSILYPSQKCWLVWISSFYAQNNGSGQLGREEPASGGVGVCLWRACEGQLILIGFREESLVSSNFLIGATFIVITRGPFIHKKEPQIAKQWMRSNFGCFYFSTPEEIVWSSLTVRKALKWIGRAECTQTVWDPASQSMELFCQLQKQWLHKLSQGGEKQNARDALAVRKT